MARLNVMLIAVVVVGLMAPITWALEVDENPINEFHLGQFSAVLGEDPIFKTLIFNEDKNFDGVVDLQDLDMFMTYYPLTLTETVIIDPNSEPWTDWHEEILSPNWVWTGASFSAPELSGLSVSGIGTPAIDFYFDPLFPGTEIDIVKTFEYTGDFNDLFPSWNGEPIPRAVTIEVMEYPTPEPATCLLMVMAGLCLVFHACRRRR